MNIYKKSDIPEHLQKYFEPAEIGLEETPEQFIAALVEVFRCVRDVLADDGTLWVNIGDSYARNPAKGGSGPGGKNGAYSDTYTEASKLRQFKSGGGVGQRAGQLKQRAGADGIKEKDLIGIPWMLAFALRADGWYLRQEIIWNKPNPMPESVMDRCTKSHESIFLLTKQPTYYFDNVAIKEPAIHGGMVGTGVGWGNTSRDDPRDARDPRPRIRESKRRVEFDGKTNALPGREAFRAVKAMRNRRSVWTVATRPYKGAHFATFPPALIEPCILAGSRVGDIVLDPFMGSGTTAAVALGLERQYLGCELNQSYEPLQLERIGAVPPQLNLLRA